MANQKLPTRLLETSWFKTVSKYPDTTAEDWSQRPADFTPLVLVVTSVIILIENIPVRD